ncbi:GNAT family N-acetyltransferase [Bacillus sp. es.034]|uniref:GNAT family N-acetyltransferase n=1 Tax=Bacillus sp. es.034 TaxID=1761763 RepID=UPI000BF81166|nr:GNAT family N-acetyltransferase [Bacillus sp. es.034]PFG06407.1 diamine N-acetyltransferase [Bacillus sp. es.034]
MNKNNVKIAEVNAENWYECCQLELSLEQQEFIEPNAISIAQSKFEPTLKPFAIYYEDKVVGFLMFNSEPEELDANWVYRIMVDKNYQGKGIGKAATDLMIHEMMETYGIHRIVVGYHPDNQGAHSLYESLGFVDHGDRFGREMAVVKEVKNN